MATTHGANALRALQEEACAGRQANVTVENGEVIVGSSEYIASLPTPFRAGKQEEDQRYSIGALAFFARFFASGFDLRRWAQYSTGAKKAGVSTVNFSDARSIAHFLQGHSVDSLLEEEAMRPPTSDSAAATAAANFAHADADGDASLADLAGRKSHQPTSLAELKCRRLQTRSSAMCRPQKSFDRTLELLLADRPIFDQKAARHEAQQREQKAEAGANGTKRKFNAEEKREKERAANVMKQGSRMALPSNRFGRMNETQFYADRLGTDIGDLEKIGVNPEGTFLNQNQKQEGNEKESKRQKPNKSQEHDLQPKASTRHAPDQKQQQQRTPPTPIIMVPQGLAGNTLVNMYNAKRFLEEGVYESWDKVRERGERKDSKQTIWRQLGRTKPRPYELTDQPPPAQNKQDWGRVAAVIVNGAKWQFKGWPFPGSEEGELVETFKRIRGFFICYEGDKVPDPVNNWNVKTLKLKRMSRHNDRAVAKDLWEDLDQHLKARQSSLLD
jgi:parafibromin